MSLVAVTLPAGWTCFGDSFQALQCVLLSWITPVLIPGSRWAPSASNDSKEPSGCWVLALHHPLLPHHVSVRFLLQVVAVEGKFWLWWCFGGGFGCKVAFPASLVMQVPPGPMETGEGEGGVFLSSSLCWFSSCLKTFRAKAPLIACCLLQGDSSCSPQAPEGWSTPDPALCLNQNPA